MAQGEQCRDQFVIGDRVVITNPKIKHHGGIFNPDDWQGVVTSMTAQRVWVRAKSGYVTNHLPTNIEHRIPQNKHC